MENTNTTELLNKMRKSKLALELDNGNYLVAKEQEVIEVTLLSYK